VLKRNKAEERLKRLARELKRKQERLAEERGLYLFKQGNYEHALRELIPLSEQGNEVAQVHLGTMYENGQGVPKDFKLAIKWYRKSAEQGYADGQFKLGSMYAFGKGVPQDYKIAAKWYRKSAEQGNAGAQSNLGYMHEKGLGVSRDWEIAEKWYRKSAVQGDKFAQKQLLNPKFSEK
jgi:hypothetical protein